MPEKFRRRPPPPFWTARKLWVVVAIAVAGLVGAAYWLLLGLPAAPIPAAPAATPVPATPSSGTLGTPPPPPEPSAEVTSDEGVPAEPPVGLSPGDVPTDTQPPSGQPVPPATAVIGPDTDADGLPDAEEVLYRSDPRLPDSDVDGYPDYVEVVNGYNPAGTGDLVAAGRVTAHRDTSADGAVRYAVPYPASWDVQPATAASDEVQFIASPDEFIGVSVQPNPDHFAILAWYATVAPSVAASAREEAVGARRGVFSPDRQTFSFTPDGRPDEVITVSYHAGGPGVVSYPGTFEAMLRRLAPVPAAP